jgi:hypothetical protein
MQRKLIEMLINLKKINPSKMAQYAKDKTDFYQEFYQNYDVNNFKSLPLLTKDHLIGLDPFKLLSEDFVDKSLFTVKLQAAVVHPPHVFLQPETLKTSPDYALSHPTLP